MISRVGSKKTGISMKPRQAFRLAVAFLCVTCLTLCAFGYSGATGGRDGNLIASASPALSEPLALAENIIGKARRPETIPADLEFTIISTGDIMMHSPQTKAGWRQDSKDYDFSFMFEKVAPVLKEADLVIGNLETPLAGASNGGFTGYPMFNAPDALAMNLRDAGFDLVSVANNHILDRQFKGLSATLDVLDKAGLMHAGAYRTAEESAEILHFEVKGARLAAIAATYGTNGLKAPPDKAFAVNYIDEEKLLNGIARARREGARYVIVMLHWGEEYVTKPTARQEKLAMSLLRGGADLILGNHPHVLQRGEIISLTEAAGTDGGADKAKEASPSTTLITAGSKLVMYSQGNFISNQTGLDNVSGLLLKITIGVRGDTGEPYLKDAGFIPVYTQRRDRSGAYKHTVWPIELALREIEAGSDIFNNEDRANIPKAWQRVIDSQPYLKLIP